MLRWRRLPASKPARRRAQPPGPARAGGARFRKARDWSNARPSAAAPAQQPRPVQSLPSRRRRGCPTGQGGATPPAPVLIPASTARPVRSLSGRGDDRCPAAAFVVQDRRRGRKGGQGGLRGRVPGRQTTTRAPRSRRSPIPPPGTSPSGGACASSRPISRKASRSGSRIPCIPICRRTAPTRRPCSYPTRRPRRC